jgi:hypothetical protein
MIDATFISQAIGALALIAAVIVGCFVFFNSHKKWNNISTLKEYLTLNPKCTTGKGIACCSCGSLNTRNFGWHGANDTKRIHICNHCDATLYRTER